MEVREYPLSHRKWTETGGGRDRQQPPARMAAVSPAVVVTIVIAQAAKEAIAGTLNQKGVAGFVSVQSEAKIQSKTNSFTGEFKSNQIKSNQIRKSTG